jgi:hypothetical protein
MSDVNDQLLAALLEQRKSPVVVERKGGNGLVHLAGVLIVMCALAGALWATGALELTEVGAVPQVPNIRGNVGTLERPATGGLTRIAPVSAPVDTNTSVEIAPVMNAPAAPNIRALVENDHPVIDETQARQLDAAAELAASEASQEYANARQQEYNSAPVVKDAEQVKAEYGRDMCSAPRADPNTCKRGIVAATPLNTP